MAANQRLKVVTPEELVEILKTAKPWGLGTVFTNGCFDLLHPGHLNTLAYAASLGGPLIVAMNSSSSVKKLKGEGRPVMTDWERCLMLSAVGWVDHVLVFDEETPDHLIRLLRPAVVVKGAEYAGRLAVREYVESYGGRVEFAPQIETVSTTSIIERIKNGKA